MTCHMSEPFQFPSFCCGEEWFLWASQQFNLVLHLLVGFPVPPGDAEQFSEAFCLKSMDTFSCVCVSVQLSHPYRSMDSIKDRYSFIFVGKLISLLLHILLSFAIDDVAMAILVLISVVDRPSFVGVALRYLKASTFSSFCPFI